MNEYFKKRIPLLLVGLFFILLSFGIFYSENFTIHGKSHTTTYTGFNALIWAYSLFCFGLSLFSILLKNKNLMILFMTILIIIAVILPLKFIS
jgi:hypothetical protein